MFTPRQIIYSGKLKKLVQLNDIWTQKTEEPDYLIWTPKAYRELPTEELKYAGGYHKTFDGIYNGEDLTEANKYWLNQYIIPSKFVPLWENNRILRRQKELCLDKLKHNFINTWKNIKWLFKIVILKKPF